MIKSVAFQITKHCPLECGHCYISASPRHTMTLELDYIRYAISDLAKIEPNCRVAFTGGEPFSRPDLLREATQHAVDHGFHVTVNTSAFFADTTNSALETLSNVNFQALEVSFDRFHERYYDKGYSERCIEAAISLGKEVEVHLLSDDYEDDRFGVKLFDNIDGVKVVKSALIKKKGGLPLDLERSLDAPCNFAYRVVVDEHGDVFPCCNARLIGSARTPESREGYVVGNIYDSSSHEIFSKIKDDKALSLISKFGPKLPASKLRIVDTSNYCDLCRKARSQQRDLSESLVIAANALV